VDEVPLYVARLAKGAEGRSEHHGAPPIKGSGSQFKNNHFTEMCCGTEAGSYLRLVDSCITQLKAQGPSRTCNESKEEEEIAAPRPSVNQRKWQCLGKVLL